MKYYMDICDVNILIEYEESKRIEKILNKEFFLFKKKKNDRIELKIEIKFIDLEYLRNKNYIHFFVGSLRKYAIEKINNNIYCLYIPNEYMKNNLREKMIRILYPNYITRLENILLDFFHNLFLIYLEEKLLEKGCSFLHASAMRYNDKTIIFSGGGQCGKSTLVDYFVKEKGAFFIGEDFIIVKSDGGICAYPKQRGQNFRRLKELTIIRKVRFFELLNFYIYLTINKKSRRIFSIEELLKRNKIIKYSKADLVIHIDKNEKTDFKILSNKLSSDLSTDFSAQKIMVEYKNIKKSIEKMLKEEEKIDIKNIDKKISIVYNNFFNSVDSVIIKTGILKDFNEFIIFVNKMLEKREKK